MQQQALTGMKVIGFTGGAAGPLVAKYLADFGAKVIKIESEISPDLSRVDGPFRDNQPDPNRSGSFQMVNSSQYSMTLNLKNVQGHEVARRLVAWADVVIENFAPGTMKNLGLNYEELVKINSDIIMLSSSIKGQEGPHSLLRAWGLQSYTEAGYMQFVGWPDRGGITMQNAIVDCEAAWYGTIGILAAYDYRNRTGKGQHIDLSQTEVGISLLAPAILDYTANGVVPQLKGNYSDRAAPHGVYRCKGEEEWCAISVFDDNQWQNLCKVISMSEWVKEPRFRTSRGRIKHREELDARLEQWTATLEAEEITILLQNEGIPAHKVQNTADLLDYDPQLKYRHFWWEIDSPDVGLYKHISSPAQLSKTGQMIKAAPRRGEHTNYICTELLGMSDREFTKLKNDGIFK